MSFNTPRNTSGFRASMHSYDDSDPWASPSRARVVDTAGTYGASGSASGSGSGGHGGSAAEAIQAHTHAQRPLTWSGSELRNGSGSPGSVSAAAIPNGTFPPIYDTAWSMTGHHGADADEDEDGADTDISLGQVHRLVASSGLNASMVEQIINMACDRSRANKSEFAVALALVALAQSEQDLDVPAMRELERTDRSSLPIPQLSLNTLASPSHSNGARPNGPSRQPSDMNDPWRASSLLHAPGGTSNGTRDGLPASSDGLSYSYSSGREPEAPSTPVGYPEHEATDGFASVPGLGSSRFLDDDPPPPAAGPPSSLSTATASDSPAMLPLDQISVRLRAELEGFIFKHNLYIITSRRRASEVTRRYSDFVWLSDALGKRYPFRLLPILPPKRISLPVPGRTLSGDDEFVEKRRRGLVRFLRALTSHPVLSADSLVQVFLTERSSLAEWRAIKPVPSLEEEGLSVSHPSDPTDAPPSEADFDERLAPLRTTTQQMIQRWTSLCLIFERITKRADAASADWMRFSFAIDSLRETSASAAASGMERDKRELGRATDMMRKVSGACQDFGDLLGARSLTMTTTTLEGLKSQRDLWSAFRDLLVRYDKLGGDNVEALRRRIDATNKRHGAARSDRKPGWEAECERMAAAVKADQLAIQVALRRRAHTRRAILHEIRHLHAASAHAEGEWRAYARREHVHAAANMRAAEELHLVLENL